MWQITWMLSFVPVWFWWTLLSAGVISLAVSWFISVYKVPLKLGGVAAIFIGTFMVGMATNEAKWQTKVKILEEKLEAAKNESKQENLVIEEKIVYRDRIIKEKAQTQIQYIDRVVKEREEVKVFIEQCPLPSVIIQQHNAAALLNQAAKLTENTK
jgi:hypothetical protein